MREQSIGDGRRRARARAVADLGESLIETVLTIVIVSVTVTALVSALGTAANAGNVQRASVGVDAVMRNFAEATKAASQNCAIGGTYAVGYTPPAGYTVTVTPAGSSCPAITTTAVLTLAVTGPHGVSGSMQIRVRTP